MSIRSMVLRRTASIGVAIAAVVVCSASSASIVAATDHPPCTRASLIRGLHRGTHPFPQGKLVRPWGCAGNFAYAGVIIGRDEITQLFRAKNGLWQAADRGRYCVNGEVPARIYQPACNSN